MSVFNWCCHHFAVNDQQVQLKTPSKSNKQIYWPNTPGPGLEVNIFSRGRRKKDMMTISSLGSTIRGAMGTSRKPKTSLNTMVTAFLIFSIFFIVIIIGWSPRININFILDPRRFNQWRFYPRDLGSLKMLIDLLEKVMTTVKDPGCESRWVFLYFLVIQAKTQLQTTIVLTLYWEWICTCGKHSFIEMD